VSGSPSGYNVDIELLEQRNDFGNTSASGRTSFLLEMNKAMVMRTDNSEREKSGTYHLSLF